MADFQAPKGPDNYQNHQERPAYMETANKLGVGPQMGKLVYDTQKGVATIFVKGKAKEETDELREDFRKTFIEKLKKLPDYEGSKVKEAIEKGTIEIKKIPNRDVYAIYESKTGNIVYLTELDGSRYVNVAYFRTKPGYEDGLISGYIRQGYGKIELDNKTGLRELYKKDGKKVPIFSDEYATTTLNAINNMIDIANAIMEEAKKRRKEGRIN